MTKKVSIKNDSPCVNAQDINELASQCVKCGLCLEHCPTYQLTKNESESPRGRIAIMQAIAEEQLPINEASLSHLNNCLTCRSCEPVCPAHVQYGELITKGRCFINDQQPNNKNLNTTYSSRFLKYLVQKPSRVKLIGRLLRFAEITQLRRAARLIGLTRLLGLKQLESTLPKVPPQQAFASIYPADEATKQGDVALFIGCLSTWSDRETLEASIFVLQKLGFAVHVPSEQHCCGAMALHSGEHKQAFELAQKNLVAFLPKKNDYDFILSTASGCGLDLKEYPKYFSSLSNKQFNEDLKSFSEKILDISEFIANCKWPSNITLSQESISVLLHSPCTLKNGLKAHSFSEKILKKIPNIQLEPLTTTENCCGAAGTYMLENPGTASQLAKKMLSKLGDIQVDFIASSNIGCGLHLKKELQIEKHAIKVIHPITILAKSMGF